MSTSETNRIRGPWIVLPLAILTVIVGIVFLTIQLSGRGSSQRNYLVLHFTAGLRDLDEGFYADAVKNLTPVVEAGTNPATFGFRGEAYLRLKQFVKAESDFREAVEREPAVAANHAGLGIALASQGRNEEALPHLEQALELLNRSDAAPPGEIRRTGDSVETVAEWRDRVQAALRRNEPVEQAASR